MLLRTEQPSDRDTAYALALQNATFSIASSTIRMGASGQVGTQDWAQNAAIERAIDPSGMLQVNDAQWTLQLQRDPFQVPATAQLAKHV